MVMTIMCSSEATEICVCVCVCVCIHTYKYIFKKYEMSYFIVRMCQPLSILLVSMKAPRKKQTP